MISASSNFYYSRWKKSLKEIDLTYFPYPLKFEKQWKKIEPKYQDPAYRTFQHAVLQELLRPYINACNSNKPLQAYINLPCNQTKKASLLREINLFRQKAHTGNLDEKAIIVDMIEALEKVDDIITTIKRNNLQYKQNGYDSDDIDYQINLQTNILPKAQQKLKHNFYLTRILIEKQNCLLSQKNYKNTLI